MANTAYDPEIEQDPRQHHASNPDLGPGHNAAAGKSSDPRGENIPAGNPADPRGDLDRARNAEQAGDTGSTDDGSKKGYDPSNIRGREQFSDSNSLYNGGNGRGSEDGGLYNSSGDQGQRFNGARDKARKAFKGKGLGGRLKGKKIKTAIALAAATGTISLCSLIFFGGFGLTNFMKNVEAAGFGRYQVDLTGRSSKWYQAYMELRMGEVDDPNLAPKDRDNILFRANRVDTNHYWSDWYRTLRASKFEQDVFEKQGIKFTSVAYKDGNITKFRPGKVTFIDTDKELTFDPSQKAFDAIARGDVNVFNGELRHFVEVEVYGSDKEGRAAIKAMVSEHEPGFWKAVKRWHLRQDIQNMTGVRSWRFFDEKRTALTEKKISIRNKIITNALPDDSKSGKFIECLFGISSCKGSTDPGNPDGRAYNPDGVAREGDKTDGDPNDPKKLGDGNGTDIIKDGLSGSANAGKSINKIASKLAGKANLLSLMDSLARFNQSMQNHSMSNFIMQAKKEQVAGVFTVFAVASDQLTTGQVSSEEVGEFMDQFSNPTNSEGWAVAVDQTKPLSNVSAESGTFTPAKNKKEFCSEKHQDALENPENRLDAESEYQYLCPKARVGSEASTNVLEDAWNSGPGAILGPPLEAFHAATGGIFDVINSVIGTVTGPIISGTLSVLGLQDNVENLAAWGTQKAVEYGGGGSNIDDDTPSGQVGNAIIQGSAVLGEASMRDQGGAATTAATATQATKSYNAYLDDQAHSSLTNRYFALGNPRSLLSRQVFALSSLRLGSVTRSSLNTFGSALSAPYKSLLLPVHAADHARSPYAAAKLAGIETFDMPSQCLNASPLGMTPQSSTNADDLGIFAPDELNWDMMSSKKDWYDALYAKLKDKYGDDDTAAIEKVAKTVWNCALFDNTVRGGISAPYGYKGEGAYGSDTPSAVGTDVSDDIKAVAQEILDNENITYVFSAQEDVTLASKGKPGTAGAPIDIRLLQIVAALGIKHKVIVSAYESHGQGHSAGSDHYTGHAVDIAKIDGKVANQNITDFYDEFKQYAAGATFLQGQCSGVKPTPPGMTRKNIDSCDHQHISVD